MVDLEKLERLAQAVLDDGQPAEDWYDESRGVCCNGDADARFIAALSPEVVLRWVERTHGLEKEVEAWRTSDDDVQKLSREGPPNVAFALVAVNSIKVARQLRADAERSTQ
jgi:hypothetical protein